MGVILRNTKILTVLMFTVFIVILLFNSSYGFTADGFSSFISEVKDFSVSDLGEDAVDFIVDGMAYITIAIYDIIMEGVHSQDVDTGMNDMLDVIGFDSVESLVRGLASTVKNI